jgi:hypothetical protein
VSSTGRTLDKIGDTTQVLDKAGDVAKQVDRVEDVGKLVGQTNTISKYDDIYTYKYNSFDNPGPLSEFRGQPHTNFYGGRYDVEVLNESKRYFRAGDANTPLGQWFTETPPNSVAEVRINTAVKEQWLDKNGVLTGSSPINTVYEIEIPIGTTIYKGPVGPQGGIYQGGLNVDQIYIKEPWNIEGVKIIESNQIK